MLFLFLDTETSGVNFHTDRIIEVGGTIIEFNEINFSYKIVSTFESLVKSEFQIEDKITRITGITNQDLVAAPSFVKAQEDWANWLEQYEHQVQAVIGHSLFFDLNFLRNENWFLPAKLKEIDTLDLAKIFFPNFQAVNLEFLLNKLKLDTNLTQDHRSLSDTLLTVKLFQKILLTAKTVPLNQKYQEFLKKYFLPLNFNFYESGTKPELSTNKNSIIQESTTKINLSGEIKKPPVIETYNNTLSNLEENKILELLDYNYTQNQALFLAQIYVASVLKKFNPNINFKFHSSGQTKDFWWLDILLSVLKANNQETKNNSKYVLEKPESLLWQSQKLFYKSWNLGRQIEIIHELFEFLKLNKDRWSVGDNLLKLISRVISEYDFLLFHLQPFLIDYKYVYNPNNLPPLEKPVQEKLDELLEHFRLLGRELIDHKFFDENNLIKEIKISFLDFWESFDPDLNKIINFQVYKNSLILSQKKPNFSLKNNLQELLNKYPGIEIETNLSDDDWQRFIDFSELKNIFGDYKVQTKEELETINSEGQKLSEFYESLLQESENQNKPSLVLGGQNSSLRDSQRILTENFEPEEYLILGESGSFTKIASKLASGFKGVTVIKISNYFALLNQKNTPEFSEIWVLNWPYINLGELWIKKSRNYPDSREYFLELKKLNLNYHLREIQNLTGKPANFVRSYEL